MNTNWMSVFTSQVPGTDNPFVRAVGAGATSAALIAGTTAFAPVGAVGAGWGVVYGVSGSTLTYETVREFVEYYEQTEEEKQEEFDWRAEKLKKVRDEGVISEEEFRRRMKALIEEYL
jgi:hypothetical protein